MSIKKKLFNSLLCCVVFLVLSCSPSYSDLSFLNHKGQDIKLFALDKNAKKAIVDGTDEYAWFAFDRPLYNVDAIEIFSKVEFGSDFSFSLGFVKAEDFTKFPRVKKQPEPRSLSEIQAIQGDFSIRMAVPSDILKEGLYGFAVKLSSNSKSRIKLVKATVAPKEIGWDASSPIFWSGFPDNGGTINAQDCYAGNITKIPPFVLEDSQVLNMFLDPQNLSIGSPEKQERIHLSVGKRKIAIRLSPRSGNVSLPARFFTEKKPLVTVEQDVPYIKSMRLIKENSDKPLAVDPHMIIEWPQETWKKKEYEIFSWDRFPTVYVFDTANYAIQDALFKRLAFFVEKQGFRGRIVKESEIANLHGFNAHDYRAENLAHFFDIAEKQAVVLNPYEKELKQFLFDEKIIQAVDGTIVPGLGAVLSISRESPDYLRYLFIAHEGYHGIYFTQEDYRNLVAQIYKNQDAKAIDFLKSYFSIVDSLGYDLEDSYLMENEFMAYLMQQSITQVAAYFTGTIHDRFLRYKGDSELAHYIKTTNAESFVRATKQLNEYVFSSWGLQAGRVGLFLFF